MRGKNKVRAEGKKLMNGERGRGGGAVRENCNDKRQVKVNVVCVCVRTHAVAEGKAQKGGKANSDEMQIAADLCHKMAANEPTKGSKQVRSRAGSEREQERERKRERAREKERERGKGV